MSPLSLGRPSWLMQCCAMTHASGAQADLSSWHCIDVRACNGVSIMRNPCLQLSIQAAALNFATTCFGWFPTFQFKRPTKKFCRRRPHPMVAEDPLLVFEIFSIYAVPRCRLNRRSKTKTETSLQNPLMSFSMCFPFSPLLLGFVWSGEAKPKNVMLMSISTSMPMSILVQYWFKDITCKVCIWLDLVKIFRSNHSNRFGEQSCMGNTFGNRKSGTPVLNFIGEPVCKRGPRTNVDWEQMWVDVIQWGLEISHVNNTFSIMYSNGQPPPAQLRSIFWPIFESALVVHISGQVRIEQISMPALLRNFIQL